MILQLQQWDSPRHSTSTTRTSGTPKGTCPRSMVAVKINRCIERPPEILEWDFIDACLLAVGESSLGTLLWDSYGYGGGVYFFCMRRSSVNLIGFARIPVFPLGVVLLH